jgi:hypothetical protein
MDRLSESVRHFIEGTSLVSIVGLITGWIPIFVALLPGIYYGLLIYEKITGRKIADRRKKPR